MKNSRSLRYSVLAPFLAVVAIIIDLMATSDAQTTAVMTTTMSPGCASISRMNNAETQSQSGSTCNVTDNVLRVQCQSGACETYTYSMSTCTKACESGTSNGPSSSSAYTCPSNCQTASTPEGCDPPPSVTPYYCGTTTTSTTIATTTTTTSTTTSTTTTTPTTTTTTTPTTTTTTTPTTTTTTTPTTTTTTTPSTTTTTTPTTTTTTTPLTTTSTSTTTLMPTTATSTPTASTTLKATTPTATKTTIHPTTIPLTTSQPTTTRVTSKPTTSPMTTSRPTTTPITTSKPTTTTAITTSRPTTISAKPTTTPTTTPKPTTNPMTTRKPTTMPITSPTATATPVTTKPTTSPKPTTTPITTLKPTTTPITTPKRTTTQITTSRPTSMPSTTSKPTTMPVTTSRTSTATAMTTSKITTKSPTATTATTKTSTVSSTSAPATTPTTRAPLTTSTSARTTTRAQSSFTSPTASTTRIASSAPPTTSTSTRTGTIITTSRGTTVTQKATAPAHSTSDSSSMTMTSVSSSTKTSTTPARTSLSSTPPPAVTSTTAATATSHTTKASTTTATEPTTSTSTSTATGSSSRFSAAPTSSPTKAPTTTACKGVTSSSMTSTVQPAKNCTVCQGPNCNCAEGYLGDGYDCAVDQCATMACLENEYCQGSWAKSSCQFSLSFMCKCDPAIGCDTGCSTEATNLPISGFVSRKNSPTPSTSASTVVDDDVISGYVSRRPSPTSSTASTSSTSTSRAPNPTASMTTPACYNRTVLDALDSNACGKNDNSTWIKCADGKCVPFETAYMDCKRDCVDGVDELCPAGYVTCDGCKCVLPQEVGTECQDLSSVYTTSPCQTTASTPTSSRTTTTRPMPTMVSAKSCVVCHGPNCTCPDGYVGDGIDCAVDQCSTMKCAWNEYCQAHWYKSATCQFSTSFKCYCDPDIGCGPEQTPVSRTGHITSSQPLPTATTAKNTATATATSSTSAPSMSTPLPVIGDKCYNRSVLEALVTGGCGHNDNITRIQCSDGTCVPFESAYMNCKKDCPDAIDEQCPPGFIQCDECTCSHAETVTETCVNVASAARVHLCNPPAPAKNCTVCHGPTCVCPPGYIGDGIDCAVDECGNKVLCAWNEICEASWYKSATCEFSTSFSCYCDEEIGCGPDTTPMTDGPEGVISGYVSRKYSITSLPTTTTSTAASSSTSTSTSSTTSSKSTVSPTASSTTTTTKPSTSPSTTTSTPTSSSTTTTSPSTSSSTTSTSTSSSTTTTSTSTSSSSSSSTASTSSSTSSTTSTSTTSSIRTTTPNATSKAASSAPATRTSTTTAPCRSILDAVVIGGCGNTDNVTRIQCLDGTCVPYETAYMNCKLDCPDGIDEMCMPGYVKCDGCTCVDPKDVSVTCVDSKSASYSNDCNRTAPPSAGPSARSLPPSVQPAKNCTVCHGPECKCPDGMIGDGVDCAADKCFDMTCAWNEYCQATWYKTATCQFSTAFQCVCDSSLGCGGKPTSQPTTGLRRTRPPQTSPPSSCKVCHGENCTCPKGSIGDGIDCAQDQCFNMTCTGNEFCEAYWYKSEKCEFKTSFRCVCDSEIGCKQTTPVPEPVVCKAGEFLCRSGHRKCIPCTWVEDTIEDCDKGEDEVGGAAAKSNCAPATVLPVTQYAASGIITHKPTEAPAGPNTTRSACAANYYTCPGDGKCVPCAWVDDSVADCAAGEDETADALTKCAGVIGSILTAPVTRPVGPAVTGRPIGGGPGQDPCLSAGVQCPAHSSCVSNPNGTYYCVCDNNYYYQSGQCIIHPCYDSTKPSPCDPHAWCDAGNSTTLSSFYQCHCMLPYAGDGKTCKLSTAPEPPACNATQFRCPSDGTCVPPAWVLDHIRDCPNGDDEQANLVDECKLKIALCDSRAVCTNIEKGGYTCTCQLPFYGNGFTCWLPISPAGNSNDEFVTKVQNSRSQKTEDRSKEVRGRR